MIKNILLIILTFKILCASGDPSDPEKIREIQQHFDEAWKILNNHQSSFDPVLYKSFQGTMSGAHIAMKKDESWYETLQYAEYIFASAQSSDAYKEDMKMYQKLMWDMRKLVYEAVQCDKWLCANPLK